MKKHKKLVQYLRWYARTHLKTEIFGLGRKRLLPPSDLVFQMGFDNIFISTPSISTEQKNCHSLSPLDTDGTAKTPYPPWYQPNKSAYLNGWRGARGRRGRLPKGPSPPIKVWNLLGGYRRVVGERGSRSYHGKKRMWNRWQHVTGGFSRKPRLNIEGNHILGGFQHWKCVFCPKKYTIKQKMFKIVAVWLWWWRRWRHHHTQTAGSRSP